MWDSYWPYWEFSAETEGGLCLRGINLFPYMGTEKKEDYPCQYFKFAVTRDWMSRGNRKEIESLSLLGHWLKSCLFQQWPKLITIQACCSVTNSMWKELVASEAGAHCRQPQQKDQGFGWTWNTNFSSALGFGPCPSHVPGAPVPKPPLGLPGSTLDAAHHLAPARPPRDHGGDLRCHHLALLSSPRVVGRRPPTQVPAHHAHFPARLPSHCCLARASVGQRRQRCVSAAIAASVGTPGTRRLLSGVLPDHGTEKRTLGRRAALRPGSVSVRQDVLRTKEMTSYTFDTERESVLRK